MSDLDQPIYRVHTLGSQSPSKRISAVVFDMDGTIIHEAIDYVAMRAALAMPYPIDVIVEIRAMTDETKQKECWAIIDRFEAEARVSLKAHEGVEELLTWLRSHGVRLGVFTRNSQEGIDEMKRLTGFQFDMELSRAFHPPKPAPDGALEFAKAWQIDPSEMLFVGDSADDMKCGASAGMKTVLFDPVAKRPQLHSQVNLVIKSFSELLGLLQEGVVL